MMGNDFDRRLEDEHDHETLEPYFYIMKNSTLVFEALPTIGKISGNKVQIYKVNSKNTEP